MLVLGMLVAAFLTGVVGLRVRGGLLAMMSSRETLGILESLICGGRGGMGSRVLMCFV